jgi:hypothetical protein
METAQQRVELFVLASRWRPALTRFFQQAQTGGSTSIDLGGFRFVLVDGDRVKRDLDFMDFLEGNNYVATPEKIPSPEIWIDQGQDSSRWLHIALHELAEIYAMLTWGLPYEPAHELANQVEKWFIPPKD